MRPVSAEIPIDVPRERAFEFLCDLANRPAFMGRLVDDYRLQRLDSSGVGAAARFRVRDRNTWVETVIEEVDPPYRILERGRGARLGRLPFTTVWEVTEAGRGGCEVKVVLWTEPTHPGDRLAEIRPPGAARFYRRHLAGSLAQLKTLLEEGVEPPRVAVAGGDRVPGAG